jgi:hypothetical protein
MENSNIGLLKVDVKSPQIVAGERTIVNLLIRNPFPNSIEIESIEAPNSSILKKENRYYSLFKKVFSKRLEHETSNLVNESLHFKPLTASFVQDISQDFAKELKAGKTPASKPALRLIESGQEDIASFEIETADWLFIKPTTVELYAVIKYKIDNQIKSQIVPIVLQIQPPVLSIIIGTVSGGTLGHLVRQLTTTDAMMSVSLLAVVIMSLVLAIILAKREDFNKGFITLEDFYGAFFIGTMVGYMGTEYFESILSQLGSNQIDTNLSK